MFCDGQIDELSLAINLDESRAAARNVPHEVCLADAASSRRDPAKQMSNIFLFKWQASLID
jgi:hypothetical protein